MPRVIRPSEPEGTGRVRPPTMPAAPPNFRRRAVRMLAGWGVFCLAAGAFFGYRAWLQADYESFNRRRDARSERGEQIGTDLRILIGQPRDFVASKVDFPLTATSDDAVLTGTDPPSGRTYRLYFDPRGTLDFVRVAYDDPDYPRQGACGSWTKASHLLAVTAFILWILAFLSALGAWRYHRLAARVMAAAAIVCALSGWMASWPVPFIPDGSSPAESEWYPPPAWGLAMLGVSILLLALPNFRRRGSRSPRCHRCGYDLTANESGRCPECGTAVSAVVYREEGERLAALVEPPCDGAGCVDEAELDVMETEVVAGTPGAADERFAS